MAKVFVGAPAAKYKESVGINYLFVVLVLSPLSRLRRTAALRFKRLERALLALIRRVRVLERTTTSLVHVEAITAIFLQSDAQSCGQPEESIGMDVWHLLGWR